MAQEKPDLCHTVLARTVSLLCIIQRVVRNFPVPVQWLHALEVESSTGNTSGTVYKQRKSSQMTKDHVVWSVWWESASLCTCAPFPQHHTAQSPKLKTIQRGRTICASKSLKKSPGEKQFNFSEFSEFL